MKYYAGRYKIPEMLPHLCFPRGYRISNHNDMALGIELLKGHRRRYFHYVPTGDHVCVWIEEGEILIADREFEIEEFAPERP